LTIDRFEVHAKLHSALQGVSDAEARATIYEQVYASHGLTMTNLSTAQSVLLFDFYQETLFSELAPITANDMRYPAVYYGSDDFRRSLAQFLMESWQVEKIEYQDVFAMAGVAAGLECLAFALLDPGPRGGPNGTVILPAPCWNGFQYAFQQRTKMQLCPFDLETQFVLTLADVQRAYHARLQSEGIAPRILILTNPQNPLAINYPPELLEKIYSWVLTETEMHIISDEIYTHCQVDSGGRHPPFKSALALDAIKRHPGPAADRVHVVYGLSKDFGLSGYKIGFVVSRSWQVRSQLGTPSKVFHSMTSFCPFDNLKSRGVAPLFFDDGVPDPSLSRKAMEVFSGRGPQTSAAASNLLTARHRAVTQQLRKGGIELVGDAYAGLFFWLDLRKYLYKLPIPADNTPVYLNIDPAESTLNNQISEFGQLMLLPGGVLSSPQPGYFRLCYTGWEQEVVLAAIERLSEALQKLHD